MHPFPFADLRLVRRLEREYLRATAREERAATVEEAQRLAAESDRVARRLAAARNGVTLPAPRTRRNLARGAFRALAAVGLAFARALRRAESLRRATLAAAAKRASLKAARTARASLRRAVRAVVVAVASSPALALAHPGHAGHDDAPIGPGGVVLVGLTVGLASLAWETWGPRRRALAAATAGDTPALGGDSAPEPEVTPEPESDGADGSAPRAQRAMWRTRAPFLIDGRWQWVSWTHASGSKHAAIVEKARELGASAWDFGQADHEQADRASF